MACNCFKWFLKELYFKNFHDVLLSCEEKKTETHKVILSASRKWQQIYMIPSTSRSSMMSSRTMMQSSYLYISLSSFSPNLTSVQCRVRTKQNWKLKRRMFFSSISSSSFFVKNISILLFKVTFFFNSIIFVVKKILIFIFSRISVSSIILFPQNILQQF